MSRFSLILTILLVAVVDKVSTTATVEDCYNFANYYNKTLEPIFLRNYSSCGPRQQCVCIQNCMSCNNSGLGNEDMAYFSGGPVHLPKVVTGPLNILLLGFNEFTTFPFDLGADFSNLIALALNNNLLTQVPAFGDSSVSYVKLLLLGSNNIKSLHNNMLMNFSSLSEVGVEYNFIDTIEESSFNGLDELTLLDLSHNNLDSLPNNIFQNLTTLLNLFLANNSLTILSKTVLSPLENLVSLEVGNNRITSIEEGAFASMTILHGLDFRNNSIQTISKEMFPKSPVVELLNLHGNKISIVTSESFGEFNNLTSLYLGFNKITSLTTTSLSNFVMLEYLELNENLITSFPDGLFDSLYELKVLNFRANRVTVIQPGLFDYMTSLTSLGMDNNNIAAIPPGLFLRLSKIQVVLINFNRITSLPPLLFNNTEYMKAMNLGYNQITSFPPNLFSPMSYLSALYLQGNSLSQFPLGLPKELDLLDLSSNEFNNPKELQAALNLFYYTGSTASTGYVTTENNPVACEFTPTSLDVDDYYSCSCARMYHNDNGICKGPNYTLLILLSVFGGIGFSLLVVFAVWFARKRIFHLRRDLNLHQMLLEEKDAEMVQLRNAWDIKAEDVSLVRRVDQESEGAFGEVWFGEWDGFGVAVKRLRQALYEMDPTTIKEFENEMDFYRRCRHRNIVRFFGAGQWNDGLPFLVVEYLEGGTLKQYLRKHDYITWEQKLSFCLDIQNAMQYIHVLDRVHRDLKTGNVLLSRNLRAKVGDFGSMADIAGGKPTRESFSATASIAKAGLTLTAGVGTPFYMAPEVLRGDKYGPRADVWSFGIVMWEVATQKRPDLTLYLGDITMNGPFLIALESALNSGYRLPLPLPGETDHDFPKGYIDVVNKCTVLAQLGRPTFDDLGEDLAAIMETLSN
eukprot:m.144383 g.144383  ORF g.144383 m.144383 type:complete len:911 (-) comp14920_c0_seq1:89-2821(-)